MEDNKDLKNTEELEIKEVQSVEEVNAADTETPLDKNVKLMSPTRMILRRFFRSKLSITGIVILVALLVFCWFGPVVYQRWGETETDRTGNTVYDSNIMTDEDGNEYVQIIVTDNGINALAPPSGDVSGACWTVSGRRVPKQ